VTPKKGEYFSSDQAFKRFEAETCRTLVNFHYRNSNLALEKSRFMPSDGCAITSGNAIKLRAEESAKVDSCQ